jgi:hypothetical protein
MKRSIPGSFVSALILLLATACNTKSADEDTGTTEPTDTEHHGETGGNDSVDSGETAADKEICDGIDNDGDGLVDDDDPDLDPESATTFYADADADTYGDPDATVAACVEPPGYVTNDGDCNDASAGIHPGATEVCNGLDDDCDTLIDLADPDLDTSTLDRAYEDPDGDGYGSGKLVTSCDGSTGAKVDGDCDETDPTVNPGAIEHCGDGVDNDCDGEIDVHCTAMLPLAASLDQFQKQGAQEWFQNDLGEPCQGRIVAAVGDQVVCYADATGELYCAGRVYTHDFGSTFVDVGVSDVRQIITSPTMNAENGNDMCVLSGEELLCMGYNNNSGQFGDGTRSSASDFVSWGDGMVVDAIATGTYDQICARNLDGEVWCSGDSYDTTPMLVSTGPAERFFVDSYGELYVNVLSIYRVGDTRGDAFVSATGAWGYWFDGIYGRPGHVVTIDNYQAETPQWLEDDGQSYIGGGTTWLPDETQLAFFGHDYTLTWCAVLVDGSMWCMGDNSQGKLGLGHEETVTTPTQVLPAGTFDTTCE